MPYKKVMVLLRNLLILGVYLVVSWQPVFAGGGFCSSRPILSAAEAGDHLADRYWLLAQNASFLPERLCGGTCASTSIVNAILILRAVREGVDPHISERDLQNLQQRLLEMVFEEIRARESLDPREGAYLTDFTEIVQAVYNRSFGDGRAEINFNQLPHSLAFQSVNENSVVLLAVAEGSGNHAVLIQRIEPPSSRNPGEKFGVIVSEPNDPNTLTRHSVYEQNGILYLSGYGSTNLTVQSRRGPMEVVGGQIYESFAMNLGSHTPTRNWNPQNSPSPGTLVNILLKDGTTLTEVSIAGVGEQRISFMNRFFGPSSVPYREIADIQILP